MARGTLSVSLAGELQDEDFSEHTVETAWMSIGMLWRYYFGSNAGQSDAAAIADRSPPANPLQM
jgi:hypothetical protein